MASSKNRQWTSMFKSKSSNTQHQCQHHGNTPPVFDGEAARTPHPKPRWNPKAEQIRILEGIFNSGMVNPPRDEIRRIRVQLQEYGQVGDANVFYWFQNRKSRSKHKQKQLQLRQFSNPPTETNHTTTTTASASVSVSVPLPATASYSSSKSSDPSNSSGCSDKTLHSSTSLAGVSNSPTKSASNKIYYPEAHHNDFAGLPVELLFRNKAPVEAKSSDLNYSRLLSQHTMMSRQQYEQEQYKITGLYDRDTNIQSAAEASYGKNHFYQLGRTTPVNAIVAPCITATTTTTSPTTQDPFNGLLQGIGGNRDCRVVVLINEVAFEVGAGHLNVREAFGTDAVLFHSSGLPVLLNDWGFTLHPLQHGASYFLV